MKPEAFACPRCTHNMTKTSHWRWRCPGCDITWEWRYAVWAEVEKGVS